MDYSPPGCSVHEILQARILERGCPSGFPSPGDLPKPVNKPVSLRSPALTTSAPGNPAGRGGDVQKDTASILRVALWHQNKQKFFPPQITRWLALTTRQILHVKFLSLAARDSPQHHAQPDTFAPSLHCLFLWLPPLPPQQVDTISPLNSNRVPLGWNFALILSYLPLFSLPY